MKQGKRYTTLILWIFLAAIVVYLGYHVSTLLRDPYTTTTAIKYEAGAGYYATGFVVRDETPIASDYDITAITAAEPIVSGSDCVVISIPTSSSACSSFTIGAFPDAPRA